MSRTPYVHTKKEFLQEIVEPEVQSEQIELQEVNWDDLNERQREEIIQKERLKDARPEKRPV
jgi:hypothetical protein